MVKLASSLSFGTGYVEWQERINMERLRNERAARLRQTMKGHGMAACLLSGADNIRYATGMTGPAFMPQLYYCLFFAEHDPIIWLHAGHYHHMRDQAPWIKAENMRLAYSWLGGICGEGATQEEAKLFAAEIEQELRERGLKGEKLGITGFDRPATEALHELGIKTTDVWPMMLKARSVKTKDEINCLKMAAAIADVVWARVYEGMRPGVRDIDLAAIGYKAACEAGADNVGRMIFFSGPNTFERGFTTTDRFIQVGDMFYGDITRLTYMGYNTCYYRTFIIGRKPTEKEKDWHKKVLEKQNALIDAIRPGVTTADVAQHFLPASTWGYADERDVLSIEIAHGIGLQLYEMPVINRLWSLNHPQVIEAGMTLSVETREGEWRVGGSRLEDMVVVTESGAELIGRIPRDEIIVAGAMG